MGLLPRALQPKTVVRRTAIRRGGPGHSPVWRALAAYFVGGTAMVRTQALRRSVLGSDNLWRAILVLVVLRNQLTRVPEPIATERLRPGQHLTVRVVKPLTRREQKRTGITRRLLEQRALADVAAAKGADAAT